MAKILVVDDEKTVRQLLDLHLRAAGHEVIAVEDAIAAGYAVLKAIPDLIICDINLPFMDGFRFYEVLKADMTLPRIPLIFISASGEVADAAAKFGAFAYFTKPVQRDELLRAVSEACSVVRH